MAKRYTQEWRDNISRAVKKNWKQGTITEETRRKLSEAGKKGNKNRIYKLKPIHELKSPEQVRSRLFKKRGRKCERCQWDTPNSFHNIVPVQVNHKDGDSTNNYEDNLEILCPNCHSLTEFFMCYGRKPKFPNARTLKRYKSWSK